MSVDWGLAQRLAGLAAGTEPVGAPLHPDLVGVADRAAERVSTLTGLHPRSPLPPLEVVDRATWAQANVATMETTLEPTLGGKDVPAVGGYVIAAEAGVVVGLLSRAVLGQYELALLEPLTTPRLLLVGPNLREAAEKMDVSLGDLAAWVAYHEVCHAVQFTSVPWLRDHLGGVLRELLGSMDVDVDWRAMLGQRPDPRALWEAVQDGGLVAVLAGPERRRLLDQVQGAMSLIEGHAEHVMDAAVGDEPFDVEALRAALERRRGDRPPALKLLFKLLGLDLKLQQYAQGKAFVDAVVAHGGHDRLNVAWEAADLLPSPEEIQDPDAWLRRTDQRRLSA